MVNVDELLRLMIDKQASDLHITSGSPPVLRVCGELVPTEFPPLNPDDCQRIVYSLLTDKQKETFEAKSELDLSFGMKNVGRLRMNVFRQRNAIGAALRLIPNFFMTFEELGLPTVVYDVLSLQTGLVLVTGPTGHGKTTSLGSMINYLNEHRASHIMTIEDPIEYVHTHKRCIVNQREVGSDTETFASALRHVFRQDPDIILIGEMRDLETIESALVVAETGHLVFATLHTSDAPTTINRIIDVFPPHQQQQIRSQLSFVLQSVFCQRLIPRADGQGRCLAIEVMRCTPAIRNLIRDEKIEQIGSLLQAGGKMGMQTMNLSLYELYNKRIITYAQALSQSPDQDDFKRIAKKSDDL